MSIAVVTSTVHREKSSKHWNVANAIGQYKIMKNRRSFSFAHKLDNSLYFVWSTTEKSANKLESVTLRWDQSKNPDWFNQFKRDFLLRIIFQVHEVNIMSVVQYKWPNRFESKILMKNDYREHYIYGDQILVWDEASEELQYFGSYLQETIPLAHLYFCLYVFFSFLHKTQTFQDHSEHQIVE